MAYRTARLIGTSCSRPNVSLVASPWRLATGGSRRSTITTTVSASTARCAKRTSKDKASLPKEADPSVKLTHAKTPEEFFYNTDTVYTTKVFRPIPITPSAKPKIDSPSPQRTRKLETPLHFDGEMLSDIKSVDGKLLSKVTVDRVHSSARHDVTESPSVFEGHASSGNVDYINDIIKTETIQYEDVIKVKFTPVPLDLDAINVKEPSIQKETFTPVSFIKNNYEDLTSYKIVNSVCKDNFLNLNENKSVDEIGLPKRSQSPQVSVKNHNLTSQFSPAKEKTVLGINLTRQSHSPSLNVQENLSIPNNNVLQLNDSIFDDNRGVDLLRRSHSPLVNSDVQEKLSKIDSYLQESINKCSEKQTYEVKWGTKEINVSKANDLWKDDTSSLELRADRPVESYHYFNNSELKTVDETRNDNNLIAKNSVKGKRGIKEVLSNMPMHYHAAILCFFLIVYNLIYQYLKRNNKI